jgi:hypothetical protein
MKRKWMETAVVWLLVIGPLLIGLGAAIWWGSGNNTVGLWGGFVPGAIALVFAAAFQVQTIISKSNSHEADPAKSDNRDRPWISLDIAIAGPLAYDEVFKGDARWHVPLRIDLKNTGNTPAVGVNTTVQLMPFMLGGWADGREPILSTDVAAELKKICNGIASMMSAFPEDGRTLFRDQASTGVTDIVADPKDFEVTKGPGRFSGNFIILVCVSYRFVSDQKTHQTGGAFALFKRNDRINIEGETIPVNQLGLTDHPMGGSFAN